MHEHILEIKELGIFFYTSKGIAKAVDGISFGIKESETFALVGESGCGKTLTALSIIQLVPEPGFVADGEILLKGKNILALTEREKRIIRGNRISMIFQEPMTSLNPVLTVGEQISEVIRLHQRASPQKAKALSIQMLEQVGIPNAAERYKDYPHQFSGGMKQRVMIAIALSCKPDLLIADEPTTALDVTIQDQILTLLKELRSTIKTSILLITHDLGVVFHNADQVGVMYAGKIVECTSSQGLFENPLHPYTVKLFRSVPNRSERHKSLETIQGTVPQAIDFPQGCRFQGRCTQAVNACRRIEPEIVEPVPGHLVACHLYKDFSRSELNISTSEENVQPAEIKQLIRKGGTLLSVQGLRTFYPIKKGILQRTVGWIKAVDGVDLVFRKGKTLALVGESGCGKTTVGKSIIQLIKPNSGKIIYDGQNLTALKFSALRKLRNKFQIIFQDPYSSLNPRMMAGEVIEEGIKIFFSTLSKKERIYRINNMLKRVGLESEMAYRYPHEFSGGQRQRLGIARALAVEPQFMVCDEAVSALDVSVQAQILNLLKEIQYAYGLAYLFVTHDLGVVEYMADEVAVMYLGRIVEKGMMEEIFDAPKHPYTRALLSAVPILYETAGNKIHLKGDVPSPADPPSGCHFHPRCPERLAYCHETYPGYTQFSATHGCHCYLHGKGNSVE